MRCWGSSCGTWLLSAYVGSPLLLAVPTCATRSRSVQDILEADTAQSKEGQSWLFSLSFGMQLSSSKAKKPQPVCEDAKSSMMSSFFGAVDELAERKLIWLMIHREMLPPAIGYTLLDLEAKRDVQQLRNLSAWWMRSLAPTCEDPLQCRALADEMARAESSSCPVVALLTQLQKQLEDRWAHRVRRQASNLLPSADNHLNSLQLDVKLWGLSLVRPPPHSCTGIDSQSQWAPPHEVLSKLNELVAQLVLPFADHFTPLKDFLEVAENWTSEHRRGSATRAADVLIPLLRLLQHQRGLVTPGDLQRDAALVRFYEERLRVLEAAWAQLHDECSTESNSTAALVSLQGLIENLSTKIDRLAFDHNVALPTDAGSLPAYWTGRLRRISQKVRDLQEHRGPRPRVLIWTCSFGGGHHAAAAAVQEYLPDYATTVSDLINDEWPHKGDYFGNWIRRYLEPKWDDTYVFNKFILRDQHYWMENMFESVQALQGWWRGDGARFEGPCSAPTCDTPKKKKLRRVLLGVAPDAVVVVYHMDLRPMTEVSKELGGLPVLYLATDVDVKLWEVFGVSPPGYAKLRVGLPFDVPEAWKTIKPLQPTQVFISGYSVRSPFLGPLPSVSERRSERLRRGISDDTRVALVMSGGGGQFVPWPNQLSSSRTWGGSLRVIVIAAHNPDFVRALELNMDIDQTREQKLFRGENHNVTVEIAAAQGSAAKHGQSDYYLTGDAVARLMDIADVLITKAGGSTIAEAAYRGLPSIYDGTAGMLTWEEYNARTFEAHGCGFEMTSSSDLEALMHSAFQLGHERRLVSETETGSFLDTRQRIRQELKSMLPAAG